MPVGAANASLVSIRCKKTIDSIEAYVAVRKLKYVKVFKKDSPFRLPEP